MQTLLLSKTGLIEFANYSIKSYFYQMYLLNRDLWLMLNFFFLLTDFSSVLRKKIKINDKMSSFNNFQKLNRVRIANNLFFSTKLVQKAGHRFFYKPLLFRFRFKYSKMFFLLNLKNSRTAAAAVNQTNLTRSTGFHTYPFFFQPNFRINLNKNWSFLTGFLIQTQSYSKYALATKFMKNLKMEKKTPLVRFKSKIKITKKNKKGDRFRHINHLKNNLKINNNIHSPAKVKKFFLNNYFYFKKATTLDTVFLRLHFLFRSKTNNFKKNRFRKPYLFFHNNEVYKPSNFPIKTFINKYRNFSKFFRNFKKNSFFKKIQKPKYFLKKLHFFKKYYRFSLNANLISVYANQTISAMRSTRPVKNKFQKFKKYPSFTNNKQLGTYFFSIKNLNPNPRSIYRLNARSKPISALRSNASNAANSYLDLDLDLTKLAFILNKKLRPAFRSFPYSGKRLKRFKSKLGYLFRRRKRLKWRFWKLKKRTNRQFKKTATRLRQEFNRKFKKKLNLKVKLINAFNNMVKKAKKSNQNRISSTERKVEKLNWTLLRWLYTKRKKSSIAFSRYSQFFQRKYGQISLFSKFKFLLSYRSRSFFLNKDNIPFNFFKRIFKLKIRNVNRKHGKWGRKSRKYKLKKKYKIFRGLILFNFKRSLFKSKKLKRRYRLPNQKFFLLSSQINFLNFDKYFQNQTNSLNQSKIKNLRLKVRRAGKSLIILLKLPKRFVFFRKWKNKRFRRSSRRVSLCKKTFQAPFYLPTSSPFIRSFSTFKTFANFFNFDNFLKDSDFSTNNFENLTRAKRIGLNLKLIKFHTKHGHFFKSQTSSFLLINDFFLAQILKTENVFILKRTMFSFIYKNDMQRFILRRYLKNRFVYFSQNAASSLDVRFSAPAFFFDNPNSVNLFTQLDFGNSFTQLNHLNWKKFMRRIEYSFDLVKRENDLSIKRVKFKPGYSTLWRNARSAIKMIMGLNFRYQRKLTRYLIKFYKYTRFQIFLSFELQLLRVLIRTKLLPDPVSANLFLTNGLVFLNGYCVYNSSLAIFAGDILQLVIHLKYYIVYRWLLHWNMQKKIRFKNKIRRKLLPKNTEEDKQRSNILPKWILTNKYLILDIPKYLEVDYLTLSAICVYSPFSWNDVDVYSFLEHRFGVINMYNWKYIT